MKQTTPGPWVTVLQRNERTGKLDIGIAEAIDQKRWIARITPQPGVPASQDLADAELIACAPTMLKLLEDLHDMATMGEKVGPQMLQLIESVIVRARSQALAVKTLRPSDDKPGQ